MRIFIKIGRETCETVGLQLRARGLITLRNRSGHQYRWHDAPLSIVQTNSSVNR